MTRVANIRWGYYDINCGRPSKWGNPYSHLEHSHAKFRVATLEESIACYITWILQQDKLLAAIDSELKDHVLGCWCRPKGGFKGRLLCHVQVPAGLADGICYEDVP